MSGDLAYSPYLARPCRSLAEVLDGYRAEAAALPAYHPRLPWLLGTIATIEAELAPRACQDGAR